MTKTDEVAKNLLRFNLSEYQAKALAAMFSLGRATASDVIGVVDIPKARIYGTLDELLEMGAIRKKATRPTTFIALNPDKSLQNIIDWKNERNSREVTILKNMKEDLQNDLEDLFEKASPLKKRRSFIEVIPAGEVSELETRRLYRSSKKEIKIMSAVLGYLPRVLTDLQEASKKGVNVKIILLKPEKLTPEAKKVQEEVLNVLNNIKVEIKYVEELPMRLSIVDSNEAIFSVDEARPLPILKEVCLSNNKNMVKALEHYFDTYWK